LESSGFASRDEISRLSDPELLRAPAGELAKIPVDSAVYACTSASFLRGAAHDKTLIDFLSTECGAPSTTTSNAIAAALSYLAVSHVCVAGPYLDHITQAFSGYLEERGFHVLGTASLQLAVDTDLYGQSDESLYRFLKASCITGAEAIAVPETQFLRNSLVPYLEEDLEIPVVSANIASLWAALQLCGVEWVRPSSGRLLSGQV